MPYYILVCILLLHLPYHHKPCQVLHWHVLCYYTFHTMLLLGTLLAIRNATIMPCIILVIKNITVIVHFITFHVFHVILTVVTVTVCNVICLYYLLWTNLFHVMLLYLFYLICYSFYLSCYIVYPVTLHNTIKQG